MKAIWKLSIVVLLACATAGIVARKQEQPTRQTALVGSTMPSTASNTPVKPGDVCPEPVPHPSGGQPASKNSHAADIKAILPARPTPTAITSPAAKSASSGIKEKLPEASSSQPQKTASAVLPIKSRYQQTHTGDKTPANNPPKGRNNSGTRSVAVAKNATTPAAKAEPKSLPMVVDVGSTQCIPCRMMMPILDQLSIEFKDKLKVQFVNISLNPDAATSYGVDTIPTQIFYDANGAEFERHIGFFPKDDILGVFASHGIILAK